MRITGVIPSFVKVWVSETIQTYAVPRSLRPLRARGDMTPEEVTAFHKAWGNPGFSADKDFLAQLLNFLGRGPVLECGTGATTLLANEMGLRHGFKTYSLEQDPGWAKFVRRFLNGSRAAQIIDTPLKDFGSYQWYEVHPHLPSHFALVICDGPYIDKSLGEPYYSAWRYGVLAWLKETGRTFDVLLFDDANDVRGPALLERWEREFAVKVETMKSSCGECAIVRP
jgi:hypothetical protein